MAEFEPPSFSLGLDFDLDSEPQTTVPKDPPFPRQPSSNPSFRLIEDDDDFEIPDPPWTLKPLRRGPHSSHLLRRSRWRWRRSGSRWRWVVTMLTMKLKSSLLRRIGIEIGRPAEAVVFSLAEEEAGVRKVLPMLHDEFELTMALSGCHSLSKITLWPIGTFLNRWARL
ncbi:hypothetical protein RHSIM_Rhsim04G0033600 [Rhododendron simsii]|uniref:FMN-dependent dehydrogenase domain-containing protein n=1 Tax=Rhododendron simsii TaxID=118357 RepID=A0A834H1L4_RHOSS|nr:hypothetical protein RHSIM_Rhsim04G0033600 [Rhododendron simsii]